MGLNVQASQASLPGNPNLQIATEGLMDELPGDLRTLLDGIETGNHPTAAELMDDKSYQISALLGEQVKYNTLH